MVRYINTGGGKAVGAGARVVRTIAWAGLTVGILSTVGAANAADTARAAAGGANDAWALWVGVGVLFWIAFLIGMSVRVGGRPGRGYNAESAEAPRRLRPSDAPIEHRRAAHG